MTNGIEPQRRRARREKLILLCDLCVFAVHLRAQQALPGTDLLAPNTDTPGEMVRGIDAYLSAATQKAQEARTKSWKPDVTSADAFEKWVTTRRQRLRHIIGAVEAREPVIAIELVTTTSAP